MQDRGQGILLDIFAEISPNTHLFPHGQALPQLLQPRPGAGRRGSAEGALRAMIAGSIWEPIKTCTHLFAFTERMCE